LFLWPKATLDASGNDTMKRSTIDKAIALLTDKIRILEAAKAELVKLQEKPKLRAVTKTAKEPA